MRRDRYEGMRVGARRRAAGAVSLTAVLLAGCVSQGAEAPAGAGGPAGAATPGSVASGGAPTGVAVTMPESLGPTAAEPAVPGGQPAGAVAGAAPRGGGVPAQPDDRRNPPEPGRATPSPTAPSDAMPPPWTPEPPPQRAGAAWDAAVATGVPGGRLSWVVSTSRTNELWFKDRPGAEPELVNSDGHALARLAPRGGRLAFVVAGGLRVREPDGRVTVVVDFSGDQAWVDYVASVAWSSDGRWLAFHIPTAECPWGLCHAKPRTGVYVVDLDATEPNPVRIAVSGSDPSFSPDSRQVVYAGGGSAVIVGRDGSGERVLTPPEGSAVAGTWWSPDGSKIALLTARTDGSAENGLVNHVEVVDAKDGRLVGTSEPYTYLSSVAWSPDGRRLAWAGSRRSVASTSDEHDWAVTVADAAMTTAKVRQTRAYWAEWSPDGRWLLTDARRGATYEHELVALEVDADRSVWLGPGAFPSWEG